MRDYTGISAAQVPSSPDNLERYLPVLRRDLGHVDYFLHDLSKGMGRIQKGLIPDGSGTSFVELPALDIYLRLLGRPQGFQRAHGGQGPDGYLEFSSTTNSDKGFVYLGLGAETRFAYDETNNRIGLAKDTPTARLHMSVPTPTSQLLVPNGDVSDGSAGGNKWTKDDNVTETNKWQSINDSSNTTYIRHRRNTGQYHFTLTAGTDPGVNTGHVFRISLAVPVDAPANATNHLTVTMEAPAGVTVFSISMPSTGVTVPSTNDISTPGFTTYEYTLSEAQAAAISNYAAIDIGIAYYTGFDSSTDVQVGFVEFDVPNAGGGVSAETLHKWETGAGSTVDQLDFGDDGVAGTDLQLTGNAPLFIGLGSSVGSGIRLYADATNARLEAGSTAQANMNLILGGNRQVQGTLLTSNFTNTRMNGALQLNGATSGRLTIQAAAITTDYTLTWPGAVAASTAFLQSTTGGVLSWVAASGFAASTEPYVTIGNTAGLSAERALTGTSNQIVIADNGANSTVVLSAPQNLHTSAAFQVGTLGIGAAAGAGLELDVTGQTAMRGDVTLVNAAMLIQMLGNNYCLRLEGDSSVIGGNIFEAYDTSSATLLGYIDMAGVFTCPGGFAFNSGANIGFLTAAVLSGTRTWTFPDASGTVMVTSGTETVTGARTYSGANVFTGATVLEVSAAGDVRLRDGTTSSKLRFIDMSSQTAATSRIMGLHDSTGYVVQSGYEAVTAGNAVTAGVLGKIDLTGQTATVAATTIGKTLPAGFYRLSWYVKVTTAGDVVATDNLTITCAWNDGTAQTATLNAEDETTLLSTLPVSTINRAFSGVKRMYVDAGTDITITATLVNAGATNPVFTFRARLEAF